MDTKTFREQFTEFGDVHKYPEPSVRLWMDVMTRLLPAERWCDLLDIGIGLGTAHHLVISTRNTSTAVAAKVPGTVMGAQTSKSVDTVSVSYDPSTVTLADAPFWNMTTYGIQFIQMCRMVGAGGIQL